MTAETITLRRYAINCIEFRPGATFGVLRFHKIMARNRAHALIRLGIEKPEHLLHIQEIEPDDREPDTVRLSIHREVPNG